MLEVTRKDIGKLINKLKCSEKWHYCLKRTQKRANALRNISIPRFESTIKVITEALEEKEREEFTRQKVIKEQKKY